MKCALWDTCRRITAQTMLCSGLDCFKMPEATESAPPKGSTVLNCSVTEFTEAIAYKWTGQALRLCDDSVRCGQQCADLVATALLEAYKLGQQNK